MKRIIYTDENGIRQASYVTNETDNPSEGIPVHFPDILGLDWQEIACEVHNGLLDAGLFTWNDVQKSQTGITSVLRSVILTKIKAVYRMEAKDNG